jgi:isoaspartyl peptidase/L-asparaginase-like protein (Ntn-hydrolase superfamily)
VIEVDACVMTDDLDVGAVAAVPWLRHPIHLARLVLEDGEHVLLCGSGALAFARERGIEPETPEALIAPRVREAYASERARRGHGRPVEGGTVGACALDGHGRLAAATSTGGITWKRSGRIGDSAIAGAGTYAERGMGAGSATGEGEAIIRVATTRRAVELIAAGTSPEEAARSAIRELRERGRGEGGLILLDREGSPGVASSAPCMPWAWVSDARAADGIATPGT